VPPFGLPRDPAQWLALAAAVAVLLFVRRARPRASHRAMVAVAALAAAALSAAYIAVYLRGGPRIIDATSYWLEGRAMSEGLLSFPAGEPVHSVLGRFLVLHGAGEGARAAVIFPPGYPAVLALGFLAGAPMAVGPLLAGGIVVATYHLGAISGGRSCGWLAALLSVLCAALRYHTADTMAHGLAALCFATSLALAFAAEDRLAAGLPRAFPIAVAAGFALGWLAATRPVSSLALAAVLAAAFAFSHAAPLPARLRLAAAVALGTLPGLALLLAHQHAATGAWGVSSQKLYYAVSDGPPGCFDYRFGAGIGCVGEHGDFVRAHLLSGFGAIEAAGTTLRRLKMHLVDAANLEPLALLVPIGAIAGWSGGRLRLVALGVLAQIAAYVPFYFDGNYPGGGARLYADVLPLEHVLAAFAVVHLAARAPRPRLWEHAAPALALFGFAVRAGFDHAALRDRDGGRPMFEPERLATAGVSRGLVFVDTDHGFDLGFDPRAEGLEVLRYHGDALDRFAWEERGGPPAFRYRFEPGVAAVTPLAFDPAAPLAIDGASLWPALEQQRGWALPEYASGTCASAARWLVLSAAPFASGATARLALPAAALAGRSLTPRVGLSSGLDGELTLLAGGQPIRVWKLPSSSPSSAPGLNCLTLAPAPLPSPLHRLELLLQRGSAGGLLALDRLGVGERKSVDP
jgi:hypothetical protein